MGKSTSDSVLGEFVFNFVLNMLNAHRSFGQIGSPAELQAALLTGNAFSHIESIEPDGLNDLYKPDHNRPGFWHILVRAGIE